MPGPKKLVCFVEGEGDETAVPVLATRVLAAIGANDVLVVDRKPWNATGIGKLQKIENTKEKPNWLAWLEAAGLTRTPLGAVLLALDGDESKPLTFWKAYQNRFNSTKFCARDAAYQLAAEARAARAGEAFSVAVAFAIKEFECWLLAGIESLRGHQLADGSRIPDDATYPENIDVEQKRDAKGLLRQIAPSYSETDDQGNLANVVDLQSILKRSQSFRRFWHACEELAHGVRSGEHVSTPMPKEPAPASA